MRAILVKFSLWTGVALFCFASAAGCRTNKLQGTTSMAAVEISGAETLEVARAISETFQKAGYTPLPVTVLPGRELRLVFEKQGSAGDAVVYGDWSFAKPWYRTKVNITKSIPGNYLVTCDSYRVMSHGDSHFEQEKKLPSGRSAQRLLDKAKASLGGPTPPAAD